MTWSERSCCISVDPYGWPEHIYGVFIALTGLYKKLLPKNCWWPFMTWNYLSDMARVTGRNIPTQGVKSTCNTMFESVLNGFLLKEAPFIFLRLTYNGEVAKLTWPWVMNIDIPRYTFYRYWYRHQLLNVWRWWGVWCSYDEHSNFFWGEFTWRDLVTWPWAT